VEFTVPWLAGGEVTARCTVVMPKMVHNTLTHNFYVIFLIYTNCKTVLVRISIKPFDADLVFGYTNLFFNKAILWGD